LPAFASWVKLIIKHLKKRKYVTYYYEKLIEKIQQLNEKINQIE